MKNSFMNLALPLWLFSEPMPAIQNKDKAYDPIMMSASIAIPKSIFKNIILLLLILVIFKNNP